MIDIIISTCVIIMFIFIQCVVKPLALAMGSVNEDNIIPTDWDEHNMKEIAQNIPRMIYNDCIKEESDTVDVIEDFGKFSSKISMDIVRKILNNK